MSKSSLYFWSLLHKYMQYKIIKLFINIYNITQCGLKLKCLDIHLRYKVTLFEELLKHFEWSVVILNIWQYIPDHTEKLIDKIEQIDVEEIWME